MSEPLNHGQYTKALCDVIGVVFGLIGNEPQPSGRRGVLERIQAAIEEALAEPEPEEPPEIPQRTVEFYVQSSNDGENWVHHTAAFGSDTEARCWAFDGHCRWDRIQRVETSYTLIGPSWKKG